MGFCIFVRFILTPSSLLFVSPTTGKISLYSRRIHSQTFELHLENQRFRPKKLSSLPYLTIFSTPHLFKITKSKVVVVAMCHFATVLRRLHYREGRNLRKKLTNSKKRTHLQFRRRMHLKSKTIQNNNHNHHNIGASGECRQP